MINLNFFQKSGCAILLLLILSTAGCGFHNPLDKIPPKLDGISSKYSLDKGIGEDKSVIFFDNFESWITPIQPQNNAWHVRRNDGGETTIIPAFAVEGSGSHVAQIACWWTGGEQVAGLTYKLGNYEDTDEGLGDGFEEIYIRYYIKFDKNYRLTRNHGVNIGGRDLSHPNPAWVGFAGVRDVSKRGYFFTGLQPNGPRGSQLIEFELYSYNIDKDQPWGELLQQDYYNSIDVGRWYCVERYLKLNTINQETGDANYDATEKLWIDGKLVLHVDNLRYRRTANLRITFLALETYYSNLPGYYEQEDPIKIYVDNVVIASEYIGPISTL